MIFISKYFPQLFTKFSLAFGLTLLLIAPLSSAQDIPTKGPIITGYGPVFAIKNRSVKLPENFTYKVVFDIKNSSNAPDKLNRRIESVARYMNMHGINGVSKQKMDLAVVIHGGAAKDLLSNKSYSNKFLFDNPNIELIEKLRTAGVKFYICGQSVRFGGFHKEDLQHPEDLALSAMTQLTVLQSQGYQLVPQ